MEVGPGAGFKESYCSAVGVACEVELLGFRRSYCSGFAELTEHVWSMGRNVDGNGLGLTGLGGPGSILGSIPTPETTAYGFGSRVNMAPCASGIRGIFGGLSP